MGALSAHRHWLTCLLVPALTLFFAACNRPGGGKTAGAQEAGPVLVGAENTVRIQKDTIRAGPRLSGSLEPQEQARIRAEVSGSATKVNVELGERVKKGQVLARIDALAFESSFASAQSAKQAAELNLTNASRQAERAERLFQSGALSRQDMETAQNTRTAAKAQVAQAQAALSQARKQLRAATIKSPIDGVISEKEVSQGDVIAVGAPLFAVIDPSSMRLEANVPSEHLAALKVGTPVDFVVRGFPDQTFTGTIEQVAPAVDPDTRQVKTLIALPNPGGKLLAGLFAEGRIGAHTRETLVVPQAAIDSKGQSPAVLRVRDGQVARIDVTLGLEDPQTERVEIKGPVQAGDVLLTGAAKEIAPGTAVKLTGAGQAANM